MDGCDEEPKTRSQEMDWLKSILNSPSDNSPTEDVARPTVAAGDGAIWENEIRFSCAVGEADSSDDETKLKSSDDDNSTESSINEDITQGSDDSVDVDRILTDKDVNEKDDNKDIRLDGESDKVTDQGDSIDQVECTTDNNSNKDNQSSTEERLNGIGSNSDCARDRDSISQQATDQKEAGDSNDMGCDAGFENVKENTIDGQVLDTPDEDDSYDNDNIKPVSDSEECSDKDENNVRNDEVDTVKLDDDITTEKSVGNTESGEKTEEQIAGNGIEAAKLNSDNINKKEPRSKKGKIKVKRRRKMKSTQSARKMSPIQEDQDGAAQKDSVTTGRETRNLEEERMESDHEKDKETESVETDRKDSDRSNTKVRSPRSLRQGRRKIRSKRKKVAPDAPNKDYHSEKLRQKLEELKDLLQQHKTAQHYDLAEQTQILIQKYEMTRAGYNSHGNILQPPSVPPPQRTRRPRIYIPSSARSETTTDATQTGSDQGQRSDGSERELDESSAVREEKLILIDTTKGTKGSTKHVKFVRRTPDGESVGSNASVDVDDDITLMEREIALQSLRGRRSKNPRPNSATTGNISISKTTATPISEMDGEKSRSESDSHSESSQSRSPRRREKQYSSDRSISASDSTGRSPRRRHREGYISDSSCSDSKSQSRSRERKVAKSDHQLKNSSTPLVLNWLKKKNRLIRQAKREERKKKLEERKLEQEKLKEKDEKQQQARLAMAGWMKKKRQENRLLKKRERQEQSSSPVGVEESVSINETVDLQSGGKVEDVEGGGQADQTVDESQRDGDSNQLNPDGRKTLQPNVVRIDFREVPSCGMSAGQPNQSASYFLPRSRSPPGHRISYDEWVSSKRKQLLSEKRKSKTHESNTSDSKTRISYSEWLKNKKKTHIEKRKEEKRSEEERKSQSDPEMDKVVSDVGRRRIGKILRGKRTITTGIKSLDKEANTPPYGGNNEDGNEGQSGQSADEQCKDDSYEGCRYYRKRTPENMRKVDNVVGESAKLSERPSSARPSGRSMSARTPSSRKTGGRPIASGRPASAKLPSSSNPSVKQTFHIPAPPRYSDSPLPARSQLDSFEGEGQDQFTISGSPAPIRERSLSPKPKIVTKAYKNVKYQRKSWDEFSDYVWDKLNEEDRIELRPEPQGSDNPEINAHNVTEDTETSKTSTENVNENIVKSTDDPGDLVRDTCSNNDVEKEKDSVSASPSLKLNDQHTRSDTDKRKTELLTDNISATYNDTSCTDRPELDNVKMDYRNGSSTGSESFKDGSDTSPEQSNEEAADPLLQPNVGTKNTEDVIDIATSTVNTRRSSITFLTTVEEEPEV